MLSREPWIRGSGVISCWRSIDFGSQEWRDGLHVPNAVGWELNSGKIGDGSSPKENDKSVEEFLLAPLRALDKLPVNLHALQTCNVGNVSRQTKAVSYEFSHARNKKIGGPSEAGMKSSIVQPPASRTSSVKLSGGETVGKFVSASPGLTKSLTGSTGINSKDPNSKIEDVRSSTAGSLSANKISSSSSRHRKSSNGVHGSESQKKTGLPNTGHSLARSANGGSFEDSAITFSRSSLLHLEKHDHHDKKVKGKDDTLWVNMASNTNAELCQSKDGLAGSYEGTGSLAVVLCDEWQRVREDASASASPGDDIAMNLLASVAVGEISKSNIVSPLSSPGRNSPIPEDSCFGDDAKLTQLDEDIGQTQNQPNDGVIAGVAAKRGNYNDSSRLKNGLRHSSAPVAIDFSGDNRACGRK
ncbi:hypothetical protein VitviT2T_011702 [Vitis vinifera]|uniref:Uncharacterized protein n=1 Tax=Vitis vinifera TaxID=29760 RepID=A0ABY9CEV8_VITVI|nr:hypothetical protein VitviT2T_011702 [Vitis vinifera]